MHFRTNRRHPALPLAATRLGARMGTACKDLLLVDDVVHADQPTLYSARNIRILDDNLRVLPDSGQSAVLSSSPLAALCLALSSVLLQPPDGVLAEAAPPPHL